MVYEARLDARCWMLDALRLASLTLRKADEARLPPRLRHEGLRHPASRIEQPACEHTPLRPSSRVRRAYLR
jgi:hypothetical protein